MVGDILKSFGAVIGCLICQECKFGCGKRIVRKSCVAYSDYIERKLGYEKGGETQGRCNDNQVSKELVQSAQDP